MTRGWRSLLALVGLVGGLASVFVLPLRTAWAERAGDDDEAYEGDDDEAYDDEAYDDEDAAEARRDARAPSDAEAEDESDEVYEVTAARDEEPAETGIFGDESEYEEERARRRRGLSPRWFWASLAVGLGLGVGAAVTGGYTLSLNELYLEDRSDSMLRDRGMSLQLTTNILLGAVGGMALVTVLLAIFTDWSRRPRSNPPEEPDEDPMFTLSSPAPITPSP